jgi:hypothetical protein
VLSYIAIFRMLAILIVPDLAGSCTIVPVITLFMWRRVNVSFVGRTIHSFRLSECSAPPRILIVSRSCMNYHGAWSILRVLAWPIPIVWLIP